MSGGAKNIVQAVTPMVLGPLQLGKSLLSNMNPEKPQPIGAPPPMTPPPSKSDDVGMTPEARARKLKQLQMGMASTITKNSAFGNADTSTPGLKAKLGA